MKTSFTCLTIIAGVALCASVALSIYFLRNAAAAVAGWPETTCTIQSVFATNTTIGRKMMCEDCVEVIVYATSPICNNVTSALEMHVAIPRQCVAAPACLLASYAPNKTLACFVNQRCTTFELAQNHPPHTKVTEELGYGIIMAISVPFFLCIFVFVLRETLKERKEEREDNENKKETKATVAEDEVLLIAE